MPYAYRKSERIRKNSEFMAIMKGKRLSVDGLSLFYTGNETGNFRVGIAISKKLANASTRNRLKRQIRASVMKTLRDRTQGFDLVFVGRRELVAAGYERIMKAVETVLQRTVLRDRKQESTGP
jgi:ribonuclease P protein component